MLINIDHIADLTGSTRRTVVKRCQDLERKPGKGREILYESREALPVMFGLSTDGTSVLEGKSLLDQARTRLASAQANKTELEVDVIKGNLIPAELVKEAVDNMISAFRSRMLSIPTKAAQSVIIMADPVQAEDLLRAHIYEALEELSEYDPEKYTLRNDKSSSEIGGTTTSTNSEPMGRQQKKTVKGSKRRTGPVEH